MDKARKKKLKELQKIIKCKFKQLKLLNLALTHKSFAYQSVHQKEQHNERLEFLGDAVLSLITSEYLHNKYSDLQEGGLTKLRAQLVCAVSLQKLAANLGLGEYILFGKGQSPLNSRARASNLTRAFEALIAAIYLDRGLKVTQKFVIRHIETLLEDIHTGKAQTDYKSLLQELSLEKFGVIPHYEVIKESGPEHRKEFAVCVKVNGKQYGSGSGPNKKSAQQVSAKEAMARLTKEG